MICNLHEIGSGLIDLIFPPRCTACGQILAQKSATSFCKACHADFAYCVIPLCPICGAPYADRSAENHPCGSCLVSPPPFAVSRSVAAYQGVLQDAIHRLKYGRDITLAKALGQMMANFPYPAFNFHDYTLVMPVPLHVKRLRARGFNQSLLLAHSIAKRHGLQLDYRTLARSTDTAPQINFGRKERQLNVKGAFTVTTSKRIKGMSIVLVDDVLTTGSTAWECARVLKRAGAASVAVLTLCRTLH